MNITQNNNMNYKHTGLIWTSSFYPPRPDMILPYSVSIQICGWKAHLLVLFMSHTSSTIPVETCRMGNGKKFTPQWHCMPKSCGWNNEPFHTSCSELINYLCAPFLHDSTGKSCDKEVCVGICCFIPRNVLVFFNSSPAGGTVLGRCGEIVFKIWWEKSEYKWLFQT
jgi:hypothetical protein